MLYCLILSTEAWWITWCWGVVVVLCILERASASELASGRTVCVTSGWTVSHPNCHDSILCNTHTRARAYLQAETYVMWAYRLMLLSSQLSVEWDCVIVVYMLRECDYDCTVLAQAAAGGECARPCAAAATRGRLRARCFPHAKWIWSWVTGCVEMNFRALATKILLLWCMPFNSYLWNIWIFLTFFVTITRCFEMLFKRVFNYPTQNLLSDISLHQVSRKTTPVTVNGIKKQRDPHVLRNQKTSQSETFSACLSLCAFGVCDIWLAAVSAEGGPLEWRQRM